MDKSIDKVIVPLGKTVTFSFEIDGKKVEADQGIFDNKVYPYAEPLLRNKGASINKGSFTAPKDTDTYKMVYNLKIPSSKWGTDDVDVTPYDRAVGLFYLRFESKPGQYGTKGQTLSCSLVFNGKEKVENNPSWGPDKGPFEHIEGFRYDSKTRHRLVSEWTLTNHTAPGVYAYTPQLTSPDGGEVTFGAPTAAPPPPATPGGPTPAPVQPTFSVSVKVLVQLQIAWPEDYPPFVNDKKDDIDWKIDTNGAKALGNFYGVFKLLPEEFRKDIREVSIRRRVTDKTQGGFMSQTFWEIIISDDEIKRSHGDCRAVSHHFVHEMAHASNFKRTGALWGQFWPGLATILTEIGLLTAAALVAGGVMTFGLEFVVIVAAVEIASVLLATKGDMVSDWSKAAAWQCNHFGWHVIPVIGHFISSIHKTEPNMFFSIPSLKTCGWLASYFGLENKKMIKEGSWRKADFVSDYATNNPLEDFADSFASLVLSEKMLRKGWGMEWPDVIPPGAPDPVGETVFPKKKKTFGDRAKFLKDLYLGGGNPVEIEHHITVQYDEFDFDITGLKKKAADTKASAKADESRAAFEKSMAAIQQLRASWDNGSGPLFERNRGIMAKLAVPVRQNPTPLEMLRTLELHGDGWKLYEGKEQPVEKGDLVADAAQQTWMISVTDEQKKLQQVAGGFTYRKGMKPEDLVKDHAYFKLTWSPSSEKRNWLPNAQKASPYYKDLDAVFTHMIRLWGEQKAESGRMMNSCKGFLHEWLHTAEIWNASYPFSTEPGMREVMNYLESHGKGLQVLEPSVAVAPGDLLIPFHRSSVAMITRTDKEKQTVDILESGTFDKGMLGEPADTARMRYGIPLSEFQYYWAPSPEPRQLI
jgi:hypothetical protein